MKYYLPFVYFFKSRAKTFLHRASFFVLIVFPTLIYWLGMNGFVINIDSLLIYFLSFIGMFSIYEIGYLYNDVYTTKFEIHPSYWLPEIDRVFINNNYLLLIAARIVYVLVCCVFLKNILHVEIYKYCILLVVLYVIYAIHNSIRNRWNILTDFCLQFCKYCSIFFLFEDSKMILEYCIMMIFTVPLIRTMEFCNKERLQINIFNKIDVSVLRVIYYSTLVIVSFLLYFCGYKCISLISVSSILLLFRIISLILLKNKKIMLIREKNFEDVK